MTIAPTVRSLVTDHDICTTVSPQTTPLRVDREADGRRPGRCGHSVLASTLAKFEGLGLGFRVWGSARKSLSHEKASLAKVLERHVAILMVAVFRV